MSASVTSLQEFREARNKPRDLYTYQELSEALRRSVTSLKRDRAAGMPVARRYPGRLLFDLDECVGWFERRARRKR